MVFHLIKHLRSCLIPNLILPFLNLDGTFTYFLFRTIEEIFLKIFNECFYIQQKLYFMGLFNFSFVFLQKIVLTVEFE